MNWNVAALQVAQRFPGIMTLPTLDNLDVFYALTRSDDAEKWLRAQREYVGQKEKDLTELMDWLQLHHLVLWVKYHMPTFKLTPELAAMLALTDLTNLKFSDVKFPFPTYAVEIPLDWEIRRQDASMLFVHNFHACPGGWKKSFTTDYTKQNQIPALFLRLGSRSDEAGSYSAQMSGNIINKDLSVEKWLRSAGPLDGGGSTEGIPLLQAAAHIGFGVALYVAERGKGEKQRRYFNSRTFGDRQNRLCMKPEVWRLSAPIIIGRELVDAAKAITERGDSPCWRVKSRHVVRGHWRNQACGPKHMEHRMKWIRPYWKGPAEGELLIRTYEAQVKGTQNDSGLR